MQLHFHPTRHEALTASNTLLTRWSLETNPATILAQISTAPESVFHFSYAPNGQLHTYGGVTRSPDGILFACQQLAPNTYLSPDPCVIEWRRWEDLSVARTCTLPQTRGEIEGLASSPDGRWLVIGSGYAERLFLLDWQTGEVMSHHAAQGYLINGLTFDVTSTFLAGVFGYDGVFLELWRLDPVESFVPRPPVEDWRTQELVPQDEVRGSMALSPAHEDLNWTGVEWPNPNLAYAAGLVAFSPDSRIVLFSLHSSVNGGECALVAFEMRTGQQLWWTRHAVESSGPCIFSPDSSKLLLPEQGGDLLVYRVEDGTLEQRLPTGLGEPVQELAFEHDGEILWLATEEQLVQYQPLG